MVRKKKKKNISLPIALDMVKRPRTLGPSQ